MPKFPNIWTPERKAMLRRLYAKHSFTEMAHQIGVSEKAVRQHCYVLGLKGKAAPPWTAAEIQMLRDAYAHAIAEDVNLTKLAKRLGRLKSNVCRKAGDLGLTNQYRPMLRQPRLDLHHQPKFAPGELTREKRGEIQRAAIRRHGHPRGMKGKGIIYMTPLHYKFTRFPDHFHC